MILRLPFFSMLSIILLFARMGLCNNWYVDNAATGSTHNGSSWATAWTSLGSITGLAAGDTVFISGGTDSQTYVPPESYQGSLYWLPEGGSAGHPITYKVGQDPGHNGLVIFNGNGGQFLPIYGTNKRQYLVIDGNYQGQRHIRVKNFGVLLNAETGGNVALKYITTNAQVRAYDADAIELDHITFTVNNGIDGVICGIGRNQGGVYPSGYTRNSIHDCVIDMATSGNGFGDDGIQNVGNISIYNNRFVGVNVSPYNGTQHMDGIQTCGPYVRIYNNYFENITNYPILGEFFGDGGHFQIYNNVFLNNGSQNIAIGTSATGKTITDFQIFNNTIVNGGSGISLGGGFANTTTTNSFIVNNLIYNTPTDIVNFNCSGCSGPSVIVSNNTNGGTTGISFVNAANDWRLQAGSTAAINQGISPSYITSVTTQDRDGNARPAGAWDIGAYEYASNPGIGFQTEKNNSRVPSGTSGINILFYKTGPKAAAYNLNGKKVGASKINRSGIYLVRNDQSTRLQRMLVVK